ncbi:TolC family outer membrane protein [Thioclava sp. A2]|uniref:TolC family outer membrane protein n=1 Tax=Thioclava sp. FCG-A2 TaxID=3080562 RepID=UPI002954BAD8|nr:TolC family outer membrane protein [Thioclava sp. A2]MDV7271546.1 TolC family outer membrane protein [Thioclava sp. A2]
MSKGFKPVVCAAIASLGLIAAPLKASAETLADALVSAYRNSNLLEQNRATLRAADEDVAGAVAALRPVVSWIGSAGYSDYLHSSSAGGMGTSLKLLGEMTLYDFGRSKTGVEIAKESVLATREALVNVEQGVLLAAVQAYADVKSASEQVAINQNSVRVIGEELKAAQDRFEVGEVTRTDVSLAEAQLAAARAQLAASQGTLSVARESYKAATGHYPKSLNGFPKAPKLPRSVDEARATAVQAHPAIKQAQHTVSIYELQMQLAAQNRMPVIGGSASVTINEGGSNTLQGADPLSIGVQAQQTIYSGGALSSAHRKAIAGRDGARAGLNDAAAQVSESVANAWAAIDIYRAQIRAFDEQVRAARLAYQGVKEEATLGARTTLDVLDAEQTLLDAQASRIDAESAMQVAYYQLLAAMGLLTVENLNLGIATYDPAAYYNAVRSAPYSSTQGKSLDRVLKAIGKE